MNTLDMDLLRFLSERDNWESYGSIINKGLCNRISWALVKDIEAYYSQHPDANVINTSDFMVWLRLTQHPEMHSDDVDMYDTVMKNVAARDPVSDQFVATLQEQKTKSAINHLNDDLIAGRVGMDEFFDKLHHLQPKPAESDDYDICMDLVQIAANYAASGGVYWRLEDLNKSVGPINKGTLVIVGKRPETGGTSFMCSEATFMFEQMDKDILLINNEEEQNRFATRIMSCALNVDHRKLMADPSKYKGAFEKWLDGRRIHAKQKTDVSISDIRRWVDAGDYGLVGVNVLMKVGIPGKMEDFDKLQHIGTELRNIASDHCPVIGVHQADQLADGVRYIHQDRLYKSKTALQGEADVLLMIGLDYNEPPDRRYIHIAKNKLPPTTCTIDKMKHARVEVGFDTSTGRYYSTLFKGAHSCPSK